MHHGKKFFHSGQGINFVLRNYSPVSKDRVLCISEEGADF